MLFKNEIAFNFSERDVQSIIFEQCFFADRK